MFRQALAAGSVLALVLVTGEARANPILTYDSNTIVLTPGGSVAVTGTLSVPLGDPPIQFEAPVSSPPILTIPQQGPFIGWQPYQTISITLPGFEPPPDNIFYQDVSLTAGPASQLYNLDLLPGDSLSLILGTITADASLPAGTYTADVGIYYCSTLCSAPVLFGPPNYADAGPLTIDVVAVPEPASVLLFAPALVALLGAAMRKRARRLARG